MQTFIFYAFYIVLALAAFGFLGWLVWCGANNTFDPNSDIHGNTDKTNDKPSDYMPPHI